MSVSSSRTPEDDGRRSPRDDAEARLLAIIENSDDAITSTLLDGTVTSWNHAAEVLYGYSSSEVVGFNIDRIYPPDQRAQLEAIKAQVRAGLRTAPILGSRQRKDGSRVDIEIRVSPVLGPDGTIIGMSGITRDVTERLRIERERAEDRDFLVRTQELSNVGAWHAAADRNVPVHWTTKMYEIFGLEPGTSTTSSDFLDLVHPDDRELITSVWSRLITTGVRESYEFRAIRPDGTLRWIYGVTDGLFDESHHLVGLAGACRDITESKENEARLAFNALHDSLTGLPNRALLLERIEQALHSVATSGSHVALHFVDIDRFKLLNDSRGHDYGDAVLRAVARRLEQAVTSSDTVGRLSGDEFLVVCSGVQGLRDASERAASLHGAFHEPLAVPGGTVHVTTSIGVAISEDDSTPESLLRDADLAMYEAKEHGRNRFEFFDAGLRERAEYRLELETALWHALETGALSLEFQPIASLAQPAYLGVEALLRWQHPERGPIDPEEFIGIAEDIGLIVDLGAWALEHALAQLAQWQQEGAPSGLRVSVNVSPSQFRSQEFLSTVKQGLSATAIDPSLLQLELTESALLEGELARQVMLDLDALGVRLSIDDFGVGYSSLAYLRDLPIDELKIDRSFIEHLTEEPSNRSIVAAIVGIGRSLGLEITAEGVESDAQLALTRELGCHAAQGFYFSRPLPPEECLAVLKAGLG